MALADVAAEAGRRKILIALLGTFFLIIKGFEYRAEIHEGLAPFTGSFRFDGPHPEQAELFFNFYFAMTGLHALHLTIGIGLLLVMAVLALLDNNGFRLTTRIEITGLYWHFIDVVWVFLFPILYLIDR